MNHPKPAGEMKAVAVATIDDLRQRIRQKSKMKGRQPDDISVSEVQQLIGLAPYRRDLLIEYLHQLNDEYRALHDRHLVALSKVINVSMAEVYEVATFYSMYNLKPVGKFVFEVCQTGPCMISGSDNIIDYIKKDPKQANYAVPTTGGVPEMIGEMIGKRAGVEMTILPYAGGAAIITSVLGAQISSGVTGTPEAFNMEKTGKAVVIGVSGTKRAAYLPHVPTFEESGLPGLTADSWFGIYAPKALPKPMAERFNVAMNNAIKDPDTQKKIADMAIEVTTTNFAEAEKFYAEAITFWASVYKDKPKPAAAK